MFKIDSGVPVPPDRAIYPWKEMAIGDSFFVPDRPDKPSQNMSAVAAITGKRMGTRYKVQREPGGARVWRVE